MTNKQDKINKFDPNGIGLKNNHFIGLPFDEDDAEIVLISVPWDVTVSSGTGTAKGPDNILEASAQLDLFDPDVEDAWKKGIFMRPSPEAWKDMGKKLRLKADTYIDFLENGGNISDNLQMKMILDEINSNCDKLHDEIYHESTSILNRNKIVGIVGGEHSVPLGLMRALCEKYESYGVLHIDAHSDMRNSYEDFTYSHASIFYNALNLPSITKLVQVGIRDYCEEEVLLAVNEKKRVTVFYDHLLKENQYNGVTWEEQCNAIIDELPLDVYISFDIDGLKPDLCPNTGTPVPGGLEFTQATYLLKMLVKSGRRIIGFDLCEVAGENANWDGNVGARILYKMCNLAVKDR